jgi:hypothetical protein
MEIHLNRIFFFFTVQDFEKGSSSHRSLQTIMVVLRNTTDYFSFLDMK